MALPIYGGQSPHLRPPELTLLRRWLDARGMSLTAFSRLIGCSRQAVQYWASGRVLPELAAALLIENVTRGYVPVSSWLGTAVGRAHWARLDKTRRDMLRATDGG